MTVTIELHREPMAASWLHCWLAAGRSRTWLYVCGAKPRCGGPAVELVAVDHCRRVRGCGASPVSAHVTCPDDEWEAVRQRFTVIEDPPLEPRLCRGYAHSF